MRALRSTRARLLAAGCLLCAGLIGYAIYMSTHRHTVDPTTYAQLLQLIARVESKDNYNAYFGHAHNTSIKFTDMTLDEVQQWQQKSIAQGAASSAVGKYQIVDTTLAELIAQLGLDKTQKFDAELQDRLAIALLERRGSESYVNQEISRHEFAANLAKEWAALPRVVGENPESSYYAGDGLNQALVSSADVLRAIKPISAK